MKYLTNHKKLRTASRTHRNKQEGVSMGWLITVVSLMLLVGVVATQTSGGTSPNFEPQRDTLIASGLLQEVAGMRESLVVVGTGTDMQWSAVAPGVKGVLADPRFSQAPGSRAVPTRFATNNLKRLGTSELATFGGFVASTGLLEGKATRPTVYAWTSEASALAGAISLEICSKFNQLARNDSTVPSLASFDGSFVLTPPHNSAAITPAQAHAANNILGAHDAICFQDLNQAGAGYGYTVLARLNN